MTEEEKLQKAFTQIDAANAEDPNRETSDGAEYPKELLYSRRMTAWLKRIEPGASPPLQLAVRAQHIRRWTSPRNSYPMDRIGYLKWRTDLKKFHAETTGGIMLSVGFDEPTIERAKSLIRKENLTSDQDAQTLEDVACVVFLESYFADFARAHAPEKVIDIVRKTWNKMGEKGRAAALTLTIPPDAFALIQKALS